MATVPAQAQYLGGTHRGVLRGFAAIFIAAAALAPAQPFVPHQFSVGPQASPEQRQAVISRVFQQGVAAPTDAKPVAAHYQFGAHRGAFDNQCSFVRGMNNTAGPAKSKVPLSMTALTASPQYPDYRAAYIIQPLPLETPPRTPPGDFSIIPQSLPWQPQPVIFHQAPATTGEKPVLKTLVAAPQFPDNRRPWLVAPQPMETPPGMPSGDFSILALQWPWQPQPVVYRPMPPSVEPQTPLLAQSFASGQSPEQRQPYLTNSAWRPVVDITARPAFVLGAVQQRVEQRGATLARAFFDPARESPVPRQFVSLPIGDRARIAQAYSYGKVFGDPSLLPVGRAATLFVKPRFTVTVGANKSTGPVLYVPVRMWAQTSTTGVIPVTDRANLQSLIPPISVPVVQTDGTMNPQWYRAFRYMADVSLGGPTAPSVPDIAASVTVAQAQASTAVAVISGLDQMVTNNAEALDATRQVAQTNSLTGASQIPPVQRRNRMEP